MMHRVPRNRPMLERAIVFILLICCFSGCMTHPKNKKTPGSTVGANHNSAATGFSIEDFGDYQKLTVTDPWQKSKNNQFDYYLVEKGKMLPEVLEGKQVFKTPLHHVVCLSTTHIGFIDALGEIDAVTGLSGSAYVSNESVKKGLAENRIHEVGNERGLNYEMILQLKPEVVFAYGVGSEIGVQINKLHDLGIPVVLVGEYLEQSPLAKAEWIKFLGAFFGRGRLADSVYANIRLRYEKIKKEVANKMEKPTVLTGLPFKDTWWMAGGQSNLAELISDAGGKYLWRENSSKEAFPVSLEEVFVRATKADFWINCGSVDNISELMAFDQRFSDLPAVKKLRVYNNNLRSTPGGGNDYWESGVVHPDFVLADLVAILHPKTGVGSDFYYYKHLSK